ncbi:MAG: ABC transporter permease [Treponemataceae bacterium]
MKHSLIAIRSLLHNKKRYALLFIASALTMTLTITVMGLMNGMMISLYNKAKVYFGGDAILLNKNYLYNGKELLDKHNDFFKKIGYKINLRYDYENFAYFYFEGLSIKQRKLKGIDFKNEKDLLSQLNIIQGNIEGIENSNGVLISYPLAKILNVSAGDIIVLVLQTLQGYTNTADVVVKGIYNDTSVFGKNVSYLDIDFLRKITSADSTTINSFGFLKSTSEKMSKKDFAKIKNALSLLIDMENEITDHKDFLSSSKHTYGLFSLDDCLNNIEFLIRAMYIIIYTIMSVLVIIIAIGIGSTYKVIAVKRINEIGMYMALGFSSYAITSIFLIEAFFLITAAFFTSIFMFLILGFVLGQIDFSIIPNFDIFLTNAHLIVSPAVWQVFLIYIIICLTAISLVCLTIRRYTHTTPVKAIAVNE